MALVQEELTKVAQNKEISDPQQRCKQGLAQGLPDLQAAVFSQLGWYPVWHHTIPWNMPALLVQADMPQEQSSVVKCIYSQNVRCTKEIKLHSLKLE